MLTTVHPPSTRSLPNKQHFSTPQNGLMHYLFVAGAVTGAGATDFSAFETGAAFSPAGVAGTLETGAGLAVPNFSANELPERFGLALTARTIARTKKKTATHLVILVRTFPDPAPNSASVAAPPKARPAPASFLGSWRSTSRISRRQSTTINTVKTPVSKSRIILSLRSSS